MEPAKKVFSLLDEFKNFALRGNVVDLAVGIIIGGAFKDIIDALVKNVLMPLISVFLPGEQGYASWSVTINTVTIPFGLFLAEVVKFIIVAFAIYIFIVKFLGYVLKLKKDQAPPPHTRDQVLLMEIRDLLKRQTPPDKLEQVLPS